jgi:hypothetical protein
MPDAGTPGDAPYLAAQACWKQRQVIAELKPRIGEFSRPVDDVASLWVSRYAQLMAAALEFRPDLIVELGRGVGDSTCAFTEAGNRLGTARVLSLDQYPNCRETAGRLQTLGGRIGLTGFRQGRTCPWRCTILYSCARTFEDLPAAPIDGKI